MRYARGNVKMAVQSLRSARWRTWLTMLGIMIAIISVVTIVSIGEGIKNQISGQISQYGKNLLTIRPGTTGTSTTSSLHALAGIIAPQTNNGLSATDLEIVQNTPHVASAVPLTIVPGTVQVSGQNAGSSVVVIGTTSGFPAAVNQIVQYGQFIPSDPTNPNIAVIGNSLALQLFQANAPLGQSFTFQGQTFIVAGVMNTFDTPPLSLDANFNNAIFIPYQTAAQLEHGSASLYEILAKPTTGTPIKTVQQAITTRLEASHGGAHDFSVLRQSQSLAASSSIVNLLTSLISGIASISLLVGGIGIMNVMLVSVTERTREVGIRKSLGATNRQIRSQFLTEAAVLSLTAAVIGIIISLLINIGLRAVTNLEPSLSWRVMVLATLVSLIVGILFGLIPAAKAARKDPIQALRNE